MLAAHNTDVNDILPLNRIAGFTFMTEKVKKTKVATIMARVNERAARREQVERDSLMHIAQYLDKSE